MATDNPFWDFSLVVYRKPGVADACISLQDAYGIDVNLLLYVCWLAKTRGRPLDREEIGQAIRHTADWRDKVVRPLRDVRRWLKGGVDGVPPESVERLRIWIKNTELESERLQQDMLYSRSGSPAASQPGAGPVRRPIERSVDNYLDALGIQPDPAARDACAVVIAAVHKP